MKKIILLLFVLNGMFSFAQKQMPNIQLKNLDNELKNVYSDFTEENKIYIFSFWATWCAPCINELEAINENYNQWKSELNCEIIAVSIDDARTTKRVKPLLNGKGWEYQVLLDTNQELKRALQIANVPHVIVIKNKKVVYVHNGYSEGSEEELFEKLKFL
ncbi:MAG: TlpA disulfide reductase family protein [Flavobacterium haoranii]